MPIVLVQNPVIVNDEYDWKDIEGEQYHFPNQYKNRCTPGSPFIYYRGTRRPDGKRAIPEYFGYGRIGEVWRDSAISESTPKRNWAWYCNIAEYIPFANPVPAKIGGEMLEQIARNHWSVGIRNLPQDVFDRILQEAGIAIDADQNAITFQDLSAVKIEETQSSLLIVRKAVAAVSGHMGARYSKNANPIGHRAEAVVHRFLLEKADLLGAKNIRWMSQEGQTPGWDLQYEDAAGKIVAVEVKGTAGAFFGSIDITVGEWTAASTLADRFWLYLVANCCGTRPILQRLQNPALLLSSGAAALSPVVYRLSLVEQEPASKLEV